METIQEEVQELTEGSLKRIQYVKPVFEKEEGMEFPKEIIKQFNDGQYCLQCSSCHGCR